LKANHNSPVYAPNRAITVTNMSKKTFESKSQHNTFLKLLNIYCYKYVKKNF
jgi:hypothetical protein